MWRGPEENVTYELTLTCFVYWTWMVLEMGCRWLYSCCFVECCFQDLFPTACSIFVQLPSSFFSIRLVSIHVMHPYSRMDTTAAWKKLRFILSGRSYLHMTSGIPITIHAFASYILISFSVDEMLFPRYENLSTSFRESPFSVEMSFWFWLNHTYSILSALTWRPMPPAAFSRLCSRDLTWLGEFARSAMSSA